MKYNGLRLGKKYKIVHYDRDKVATFIAIDVDGDYVFSLDGTNPMSVFTLNEHVPYRYKSKVRNIKDYIGKEVFYCHSSHSITPLTKLYPNTKLFRNLYPQGKEVDGMWEVEC